MSMWNSNNPNNRARATVNLHALFTSLVHIHSSGLRLNSRIKLYKNKYSKSWFIPSRVYSLIYFYANFHLEKLKVSFASFSSNLVINVSLKATVTLCTYDQSV